VQPRHRGLLDEIRRKGYIVDEVRVVNASGRRVAGFPAQVFARATNGRYVSLPRGDLAAAIFRTIEGKVETIFGDGVACIEQIAEGARVTFDSGTVRNVDVLVGADGLHSQARQLVFGRERRFERYLGYKVAACEVGGYRPRDELAGDVQSELLRWGSWGGAAVASFNLSSHQGMDVERASGTGSIQYSVGAPASDPSACSSD
jgi:2-polyprenyl-6-methoxyphenol hydroxylase-like FAD-dependent oxidoreductase